MAMERKRERQSSARSVSVSECGQKSLAGDTKCTRELAFWPSLAFFYAALPLSLKPATITMAHGFMIPSGRKEPQSGDGNVGRLDGRQGSTVAITIPSPDAIIGSNTPGDTMLGIGRKIRQREFMAPFSEARNSSSATPHLTSSVFQPLKIKALPIPAKTPPKPMLSFHGLRRS